MISLGLESVLIGYPVDADGFAFIIGERERSFGDGSGFISDDFLLSTFWYFDAVLSLETVYKSKRSSLLLTIHLQHSNRIHTSRIKSKIWLFSTHLKLYLPESVSCSWLCFKILMGSSWGRAAATAKSKAMIAICKVKRIVMLGYFLLRLIFDALWKLMEWTKYRFHVEVWDVMFTGGHRRL